MIKNNKISIVYKIKPFSIVNNISTLFHQLIVMRRRVNLINLSNQFFHRRLLPVKQKKYTLILKMSDRDRIDKNYSIYPDNKK